jgi:hypothetical protein
MTNKRGWRTAGMMDVRGRPMAMAAAGDSVAYGAMEEALFPAWHPAEAMDSYGVVEAEDHRPGYTERPFGLMARSAPHFTDYSFGKATAAGGTGKVFGGESLAVASIDTLTGTSLEGSDMGIGSSESSQISLGAHIASASGCAFVRTASSSSYIHESEKRGVAPSSSIRVRSFDSNVCIDSSSAPAALIGPNRRHVEESLRCLQIRVRSSSRIPSVFIHLAPGMQHIATAHQLHQDLILVGLPPEKLMFNSHALERPLEHARTADFVIIIGSPELKQRYDERTITRDSIGLIRDVIDVVRIRDAIDENVKIILINQSTNPDATELFPHSLQHLRVRQFSITSGYLQSILDLLKTLGVIEE